MTAGQHGSERDKASRGGDNADQQDYHQITIEQPVHHDGSEALVKWALVERLIGLALGARELAKARRRPISSRSLRVRACCSRKRQSPARVSSNSRRSSAHSAMMLSRVRSKLAHDGVRHAVQLTVAELAVVESHPCSHP
jgi:hypothetical protein